MKSYNTPYSHVYMRLRSEKYDRDLIYQASGVMVNFMGPDIFANKNVVVAEYEIEISEEKYVPMMQFCIDNAGKPYGMKQVLGLAYVRLCELFGKTVKNPFSDGSNTYICCELIGFAMNEYAEEKLISNQDNWTPKSIWDYMIANNKPLA